MVSKTIILLYEKNHLKHPFIKLLQKSLAVACSEDRVIMASFASKIEVDETERDCFISVPKYKMSKAVNGNFVKKAYGANSFSLNFIQTTHKIFRKFNPDIIISFLPLGFISAQIWAINHKCRSIYYPFEIYGKQKSKYSSAVVILEKIGFLLRPAAVITQNEHRAKYYMESRWCKSKPFIAHNYKQKPYCELQPVDLYENHGIPRGKKIVLYQGMLTEGRWLDRLVKSAKFFNDNAVLVMMGPKQKPWWDEIIEPLLSDQDISSRVIILESVPHEVVFRYACAASVGVIIYDDSVLNNRYCEPGKLVDFVHAGVPVIAPAFPSIKPVIDGNKLGVTFSDYSENGIAAAVNELLMYPDGYFESSLKSAAEYMTWEKQWPAMIKEILGDKS